MTVACLILTPRWRRRQISGYILTQLTGKVAYKSNGRGLTLPRRRPRSA